MASPSKFSSSSKADIDEPVIKKYFVFSRHCLFEDVSYLPGSSVSDAALIERIMADPIISKKGQLNFI